MSEIDGCNCFPISPPLKWNAIHAIQRNNSFLGVLDPASFFCRSALPAASVPFSDLKERRPPQRQDEAVAPFPPLLHIREAENAET